MTQEININRLVIQPVGSKICGHCCISMVTDTPIEDVIKLIGHQRGTTARMVVDCLFKLDFAPKSKLKPITGPLHGTCMLTIKWFKGGSHWVVYHEGTIYDPFFGIYPYTDLWIQGQGEYRSYLQIVNLVKYF